MSFGPLGRQHQPGVEDAPVVDALGPEPGEGRVDEALEHLVRQVVAGEGDGAPGTHAAGVGADVAVAHPLEVLGGGQGHGALAVAHDEHRRLGAGEALLDDHGPTRGAERRARELVGHVGLGLGQGLGDQHALAGGQAVGLHHVEAGQGAQEGDRRLDLGEHAVAGGGDPGVAHQVLHEGLGPLQPGAVGAGAEHQPARGPQPVGQAVDQGLLGADHEQVGVELLGRGGHRPGIPGLPGVTTTSAVRPRTSARACSRPPPPTTQTFTAPTLPKQRPFALSGRRGWSLVRWGWRDVTGSGSRVAAVDVLGAARAGAHQGDGTPTSASRRSR